jgi:hypothetical protein
MKSTHIWQIYTSRPSYLEPYNESFSAFVLRRELVVASNICSSYVSDGGGR